jgi:hypothetical protein
MQFTELQIRTALVVGPQVVNDGAIINARGDKQGAAVVTQLHGKYHETVLRGNVFDVCNQTIVSVSAALTTTYTGLCMVNPPGSGVNMSILEAYYGLAAVGAAGAIGLMTGYCAGTIAAWATLLAPLNRLTGGRGSVGVVDEGLTLPEAPKLRMTFASVGSVATSSWGFYPGAAQDIGGGLIITPGYYVAFYSYAGLTSNFIGGLMWEELPI